MRHYIQTFLLSVFTALFCVPLLKVCLYGGDKPFEPKTFAEYLLIFAIFSPVFSVFFSHKNKKLQLILFVLFSGLFIIEWVDGITPTSQLNHEGSDIAFIFLHFSYFIISLLIIMIFSLLNYIKSEKNNGSVR